MIKPDAKANARFYGRRASARQILLGGAVPVPASALGFVAATVRLASAG